MPINPTTDIQYRLSGGAANTDPFLSRGGAMSTDSAGIIADNTMNSIFDNVTGPESSAGRTEFRCIFIKNNHGSITFASPKIYIYNDTASGDDHIEIGTGLVASGVGIVEQTIGSETTAPSSISFQQPLTVDAAIPFEDIPPGGGKGIWIKRVVNAGAQQYEDNFWDLEVVGATL